MALRAGRLGFLVASQQRRFAGLWPCVCVGLSIAACSSEGPTRPNNQPTGATITSTSPEGQALVGATRVTFAATAADPDGDLLTYTWNLGDGGTAVGQTVTHVYNSEGSFTATLTVADGRGASTMVAATRSVTARTLTGVWLGAGEISEIYDLAQLGSTLTGRRTTNGYSGPLRGSVADVRFVTFAADFVPNDIGGGFCPLTFTGDADSALNELTGSLTVAVGCGRGGGQSLPVVLRRQ